MVGIVDTLRGLYIAIETMLYNSPLPSLAPAPRLQFFFGFFLRESCGGGPNLTL